MGASDDRPSFSAQLRKYRLGARLTQEALAERAGLSVRAIQYLEAGRGQPNRETARRLVEALNLVGGLAMQFEAAGAPTPRHWTVGQPARRTAALSWPDIPEIVAVIWTDALRIAALTWAYAPRIPTLSWPNPRPITDRTTALLSEYRLFAARSASYAGSALVVLGLLLMALAAAGYAGIGPASELARLLPLAASDLRNVRPETQTTAIDTEAEDISPAVFVPLHLVGEEGEDAADVPAPAAGVAGSEVELHVATERPADLEVVALRATPDDLSAPAMDEEIARPTEDEEPAPANAAVPEPAAEAPALDMPAPYTPPRAPLVTAQRAQTARAVPSRAPAQVSRVIEEPSAPSAAEEPRPHLAAVDASPPVGTEQAAEVIIPIRQDPAVVAARHALMDFYVYTEREWSIQGYTSAEAMRQAQGNSQSNWLDRTRALASTESSATDTSRELDRPGAKRPNPSGSKKASRPPRRS